MILTAFGEKPEKEMVDPYWVPAHDREDTDSGPLSDAFDDETGNDIPDEEE